MAIYSFLRSQPRTTDSTDFVESFFILCSHNLKTRHPLRRRYAVIRRSLFLLRSILLFQKSSFNKCRQRGYCQPCQKSLSKKTHNLALSKTISGRPRSSATFVENLLLVARLKRRMNLFSNSVPFDFILDISKDRPSLERRSFPFSFLKFLPK